MLQPNHEQSSTTSDSTPLENYKWNPYSQNRNHFNTRCNPPPQTPPKKITYKAFNIQYMLKLHLIKVIAQFKSLSARFNSKSQSYAQPIPSINIYAIRYVIEH